jgi:ketosteroid isomerase-like protein
MEVAGFAESSKSTFDLKILVSSDSDIVQTANQNRQTVIRAYESMFTGDFDSWWEMIDPNVHFYEADGLPYACSLHGLEAAKQGVAGMFANWSALDLTLEEFTAAGDLVIIYLKMNATSRTTGKIYNRPGTEFFRFKNGKVIEWCAIYWDTHEVRKICGLE